MPLQKGSHFKQLINYPFKSTDLKGWGGSMEVTVWGISHLEVTSSNVGHQRAFFPPNGCLMSYCQINLRVHLIDDLCH